MAKGRTATAGRSGEPAAERRIRQAAGSVHSGWLLEQNLVPWLEVLSGYVGYDFGSPDAEAFSAGLAQTDSDKGMWFTYELAGREAISLRVARDVGTEVIRAQVRCSDTLTPRVSAVTDLCASYRLEKQGSPRLQPNKPLQLTGYSEPRLNGVACG